MKNLRIKIDIECNDNGEVVAHFLMKGEGVALSKLLASAIMAQDDENAAKIVTIFQTASSPEGMLYGTFAHSNVQVVYDKRKDG
jgi:hypothetical protein